MTVKLDAGGSGALFTISGTVSNNSTWSELIFFYENGSGMDISDLSFQLQIRAGSFDAGASVTLSTAAGDLVIINDDGGNPTILRINVPYTSISSLHGDYIVDLASKDSNETLVHWGNGVVLFRQSPVAF